MSGQESRLLRSHWSFRNQGRPPACLGAFFVPGGYGTNDAMKM